MRLTPLLTVTAVLFVVVAALMAPAAAAATPGSDTTSDIWRLGGDLSVHDPALLKGGRGEKWYVFSSGEPDKGGGTIQIRSSENGRDWTYAGTIWDAIPAWATTAVPGANNLWAPEIHEHRGRYYLYYAVSTLGHNNSVIALATNTTLDPTDPDYRWEDRGQVVRSVPDNDFNAIDPGVVEDDDGTPWMVFGSFWKGIRMVQLEWPSGTRSSDEEPLRLADRTKNPNAIEAPYIVPHDGWYYLFTSWDHCCKGVDSNYKIVVGRSRDVTGPYVDRDGRDLLDGGGTVLTATAGDRIGPGGQSASGKYLAYHYYNGAANGVPTLGLQRLSWSDDDWPELTTDKD